MSGVEIAGIVLGAIPLVISGLEHYGDGVRTIRKVRHSSREFQRLKRTLETENAIFLNSLEILLKDDVEDKALAAMLQDAGDVSKWKNSELDACLRERLGRSYQTYFNAVNAIAQAVNDLGEALQINAAGKGPFTLDQWSVRDALRRVKFGLKMNAYMEFMDEITANNKRINQLTQQSQELEVLRGRKGEYLTSKRLVQALVRSSKPFKMDFEPHAQPVTKPVYT